MTDLDRIEALTDWCREHAKHPPPTDLLYDAVGAIANMRHLAKLLPRLRAIAAQKALREAME